MLEIFILGNFLYFKINVQIDATNMFSPNPVIIKLLFKVILNNEKIYPINNVQNTASIKLKV